MAKILAGGGAKVSCPAWQLVNFYRSKGEEFRYVLTPYPKLKHTIAIALYGNLYMSNDYDEENMNQFMMNWYRWAYEDVGMGGIYNHLHLGTDLRSLMDG